MRIQNKCLFPIYVFPLFPKQNYSVLSPNFHIHVSVSDLNIPGLVCLFCCSQIGRPILGKYKSLRVTWIDTRIGNKAAQFHFWEYINQIFGTVPWQTCCLQIQKKYSEIIKEWLIFKKVTFWRACSVYILLLSASHPRWKTVLPNFLARFAGSSLAEEFGRWEKFPDQHRKRRGKNCFNCMQR